MSLRSGGQPEQSGGQVSRPVQGDGGEPAGGRFAKWSWTPGPPDVQLKVAGSPCPAPPPTPATLLLIGPPPLTSRRGGLPGHLSPPPSGTPAAGATLDASAPPRTRSTRH